MKNERIEFLDAATRVSIVMADVTDAAGTLVSNHLAGPTAARYLAEALAGVALLGAETSLPDETVTWRCDAAGASPLGGFLVEATAAGTLRGYTRKKILQDFDGISTPSDKEVLGDECTFETIRSTPGSILSSGSVAVKSLRFGTLAAGLDAYFANSLQRRVKTAILANADDDCRILAARAVLVEAMPDSSAELPELKSGMLAASDRTILRKLGFGNAEKRKTTALSFACRCSAERAKATLAAIPAAERATLPPTLDITCHMCGKTWTVPVGG